jgi:hypothetical protein
MFNYDGPEGVFWRWTAEHKIGRLTSDIARWSSAIAAREANRPDCPRLPQGKQIMSQLGDELSYWRLEFLKCWDSDRKAN